MRLTWYLNFFLDHDYPSFLIGFLNKICDLIKSKVIIKEKIDP